MTDTKIPNKDLFTPDVLDQSVVKFLTYKAVVAEGTTYEQLLASIADKEGYFSAVVDPDGNEIDSETLIETGMWFQIHCDDYNGDYMVVESYYIELGDPMNTSGIKDEFVPGAPNENIDDPADTGVQNTLFVFSLLGIMLSAVLVLMVDRKKSFGKR